MNVYSGYFANLKNYDPTIIPISIARWSPRWFTGIKYPKWAPSEELLIGYKNNRISDKEYVELYINQLIHNTDIVSDIFEMFWLAKSHSIVLCCYEHPDKFCHRHIALYLLKQYKLSVLNLSNVNICNELIKKE